VTVKCPICHREIPDLPDGFPHRPFCSSRCKLVDLGNWLNERYCLSRPLEPEELPEEQSRKR